MKIIIAGGSGYLGKNITNYLSEDKNEIYWVGRENKCGYKLFVSWSDLLKEETVELLSGTDVVFNLSGKSINCVFTDENKKELIRSRVDSVRNLCAFIRKLPLAPSLYFQASAVGYYGNSWEIKTEADSVGKGFIAEMTEMWEQTFLSENLTGTNKIIMRLGVILGAESAALNKLRNITENFMGSQIGNGKQMMSWIDIKDVLDAIGFLMKHENKAGVYNFVAPQAVDNARLMALLRKKLNRPWLPPVPEMMVKIAAAALFKTDAEMILSNQNCIPEKLMQLGYSFGVKDIKNCLESNL